MSIFPDVRQSRVPGHHNRPRGRWAGAACCAVRFRAVSSSELSRHNDAVYPGWPSADTSNHHRASLRCGGEGCLRTFNGCGGHAGLAESSRPKRIAGQFEVRVEDLAVYPALEDALGQSMQGSLSNEARRRSFQRRGKPFERPVHTSDRMSPPPGLWKPSRHRHWPILKALVDGKHAYTLADVRAVIGSKTFALYAGLFANSNKGDVSLLSDYLTQMLGSIRVSDRVPSVSGSAQKGIAVLTASAEMPRIYVWDAMQIVQRPLFRCGRWQGDDHLHGACQPEVVSAARHEQVKR